MTRRLIDLSVPLQAGIASTRRTCCRPSTTWTTIRLPGIAGYFGVGIDQLPEGQHAAMDQCRISSHNGTHVDATYHYFSRMDEARRAACRPCASMRFRSTGCCNPA